MSDTFSFPSYNLDENDPNSRFLDLFNRFSSQSDVLGQYLSPEDPDLQKYQELASAPSRSDELISSYLNEMPEREEYKPSFGRKMASILLGTLGGAKDPARAYELSRRHAELPYQQALEEWKLEGAGLTSRARMADQERNRELQALKYGLTVKGAKGKSEAQEGLRRQAEARRIAQEVADEERRNAEVEDRKKQQDFMNEFRLTNQKHQSEMDEWRKAEAARDNARAQSVIDKRIKDQADKAAELDAINKRLSAHASQLGIDTSDNTAYDTAKSVAMKKAFSHPAFAGLLKETDGEYSLNEVSKYDQGRLTALKAYVENLTQKYLRGEF